MRYLKLLLLTVLLTPTARTLAQEDHAKKILGCWVFQKIEYTEAMDMGEDTSPAPNSLKVCFDPGGKYTTTVIATNDSLTGTYEFSADGKTIIQKRDIQPDGTTDENAAIAFPTADSLVFTLEFARLYFYRGYLSEGSKPSER